MADSLITLRPNRDLIDASFDRYILMNEKLTMRKIDLKHKAHFQTPSNEQFVFQHVKTFSGLQRLIYDEAGSTKDVDVCLTILENGAILSACFDKNERVWLPTAEVASIECVNNNMSADNDNSYPPTLLLVDRRTAVVSDGCGTLALFRTGERHENKKWTLVKLEVDANAVPPSVLVDVRTLGGNQVHVLLQTVVGAKNSELEKTIFTTLLVWLTFERNNSTFKLVRRRELSVDGHIEFTTLNAVADAAFVVGSGRPTFVADSAKPIDRAVEEATFSANKTAADRENAADNGDGAETKTSDESITTDDTSPMFNSEQLEDCDQTTDSVFGYLIGGETHRIIETVDFIGHPVLFTTRPIVGGPLSFATRCDVDGLVWQLNTADAGDENKIATHKFTLHAFGYIQAGHNEKQFTGCSPDGQYAVIVNRRNHVFVYFQNAAVDKQCELKNRRTGVVKTTVAKEVIFALSQADADYNINEPESEYIGFHAANDFVYLLTHNVLVAVHMKLNQD